ncbi:MAG: MFS transporter [Flavobacteriales bacterium]|nr:MFS transporter [Flavobacteriales bacterium]
MSRLVVDEQNHDKTLKYTLLSAIILALTTVGDAFLYLYLPANYQNIGISIVWVGVVLSINRFTRLFLNGWVSYYLSENGIRTVTIAATITAVVTTISYGIISSILLWLIVRILWGISFSTLRLGSIIYALQHKKRGISLGLSRGIIELGPVFALIVGPLLLEYFDTFITFCLLGSISFVGVLLAFLLPNVKTESVSKKELILSFPSSFNSIVLLNSFIVEGIVVVLVSRLVQIEHHLDAQKSVLEVGLLLGYKRCCLVFLSPLTGWLADTLGFLKMFSFTTIFLTFGLLLIALRMEIVGVIIVFTFGAMNSSIATGGAITNNETLLKEASDNATWRDIGTAFGSFVGSLLLSIIAIHFVFTLSTLLIITGLLYHHYKLYKSNVNNQ